MGKKSSISSITSNIIDIREAEEYKRKLLEEWLVQQIAETYEDRSEIILKNPMIRISTKFDALSEADQYKLYGYVKCIVEKYGLWNIRKQFWSFIKNASSCWKDIENYADKLLIKEKVYMQDSFQKMSL